MGRLQPGRRSDCGPRTIWTNRESGQDVLDQMEKIIREQKKHMNLEGIAFSTPGSVEPESGTILSGCIIEG